MTKMTKLQNFCLIFLMLINAISSEIVEVQPCEGKFFNRPGFIIVISTFSDSDDSICEIKQVRVDPCKEVKSKKPCKFKSGTNATIEFDYIAST